MMIGLSAPVFDPDGHLELKLKGDAQMRLIGRRVNRVKTLDGGAVANDTGYAAADRTLTAVFEALPSVYEQLQRMLKLYQRIIVSTPDGVFSAIPEKLNQRGSSNTLTLLVMQELT